MELEQAGVPSVALHTHVFARLAQSVARANGMPRTRQAYVPPPTVDLDAIRRKYHAAASEQKKDKKKDLVPGEMKAAEAGAGR